MSELNLLPNDMRRGKQGPLNTTQIFVAGLAAVMIIGGAIAIPIVRVKSLGRQESKLQEYVKKNSSILTENTELENKINNIKGYVATADSIRDSRNLATGIIRSIEKHIPSQVVLTNLSYVKGTIQINATSSDYNAICAFSANLQTSDEFSSSVINSITSGNDKGYSTSITISFGGGEAVE